MSMSHSTREEAQSRLSQVLPEGSQQSGCVKETPSVGVLLLARFLADLALYWVLGYLNW